MQANGDSTSGYVPHTSDTVLGIDNQVNSGKPILRSESGTLLQRRRSNELNPPAEEIGMSPMQSEPLNSAAFNDPQPPSRKRMV
jgi:hypothetical protein